MKLSGQKGHAHKVSTHTDTHIHAHGHTHTRTHTHIHTHTYTHTHTHTYTHTYTRINTHIHTHTHAGAHTHTHTHTVAPTPVITYIMRDSFITIAFLRVHLIGSPCQHFCLQRTRNVLRHYIRWKLPSLFLLPKFALKSKVFVICLIFFPLEFSFSLLAVVVFVKNVISSFCNSGLFGFFWVFFFTIVLSHWNFSHGKFGFLSQEKASFRKSRTTHPTVHAECFSVSMIYQTLTWTTGSLTCAQTLMHAIAHGDVRTP